jgi:uncharacterized protein (DUF1501 family)
MTRSCNPSRRAFLRAGGALLASGGAHALFPQLNLIPSAIAQPQSGYKALVCLYLAGGNDSWNLLIPGSGAAYARYANARNGVYNQQLNAQGLALPSVDGEGFVAGMTPPAALPLPGGFGLSPFCPELAELYGENRLAFIANIGSLVEPLTRATFQQRRRPPQLYSHNDQTTQWHVGSSVNTAAVDGWGGRVAGLTSRLANMTAGLPPTITLAGQTRFLSGEAFDGSPLFPFALAPTGNAPAATLLEYGVANRNANQFQQLRAAYLQELLDAASPQAFTSEYQAIVSRSLELGRDVINPAFQTVADPLLPVNVPFAGPTGGNLYSQLQQVARMIRVSTDPTLATPINANRQVFFVNLGGFDTHSSQMAINAGAGHHQLLQRLSQGVLAFYRAMQAIDMQDNVTLFTASEFARTLNSNGNGSDHAWGGMQFVVGGAVAGGSVFGRYPDIVLDNSLASPIAGTDPSRGENFARGQYIPTTAIDQLAATLARWMGVEDAELPLLFPNIDNFVTGPHANDDPPDFASPTFASFTRTIPGLLAGV